MSNKLVHNKPVALLPLRWTKLRDDVDGASSMPGLVLKGIYYERSRELRVIVSIDDGKWHVSVSHPSRYPFWEELKAIRYTFCPNSITMGILFPPMEEYVNVHPNCFHLYEVG